MAFLDLEYEKHHLRRVRGIMHRRGLYVDESQDWEIQWSNQGVNYQVYIGVAYEEIDRKHPCTCKHRGGNTDNCKRHHGWSGWVTIYPRAVYNTDDWTNVSPDTLIPVGWCKRI